MSGFAGEIRLRLDHSMSMSPMDRKRWQQVSPLLDELLELSAPEQAERLSRLAATDPALAAEVRALLAQSTVADRERFLEGAALPVAQTADAATLAGQTIGAYTLERPLGEGGMGSVWLASRSDGRFQGQVAIKFLNLALLARGGAERFAREGSMLSRLSHPNIGRLLDAGVAAGTAAGGQPYLVLEYIDGQPIDQYCDARALTLQERLLLFLDVLAAVAHAHNNLILHRDLKPSNILVTADGMVKLLDFGIAKLMLDESQPALATEITELAGRAFTPEYAAPEQVQGGEVTTATDVYALGVLLYQLLGGPHPTASAVTASPVDRLRAVVEVEPRRLSDAVLRTATASPGATAPQRSRALRGDLDNILAKALKKSPGERYAAIGALADDLRRYLNHEPITARADSLPYRASKFVRRYRLAVGTASVTLLVLLAGVIGTAWQAWEAQRQRDIAVSEAARAEQERQRAESERARAEQAGQLAVLEAQRAREQATRADRNAQQANAAQTLAQREAQRADMQARQARVQADKATAVQSFLVDIFRTNTANQADPVKARQTTARELLDIGSQRIDAALVDAPAAKLEVMATLEGIYRYSLSMHDEATRLARARLALIRQVHGTTSVEAASALINLAGALDRTPAETDRAALLTEAQGILDDRRDFASLPRALLWHQWAAHYVTRDPDRASGYSQQAVGILRKLGDENYLPDALSTWGRALVAANRHTDAELRYQEILALDAKADSGPWIGTTRTRLMLASAQYRLLKVEAADKNFQDALEGMIRHFGAEHVQVLDVKRRYALFLASIGQRARAVELSRAAADDLSKAKGGGDARHRIYFPATLAMTNHYAGRLQEAAALMAASVDVQRASGTDHLYLAACLLFLASSQRDLGRYEQALKLLDEAAAIYPARKPGEDSGVGRVLAQMRAQMLAASGRRHEAAAVFKELPHQDVGSLDGLDALRELLENAAIALELGLNERALAQATAARRFIQERHLGRYLRIEFGNAQLIEGRVRLRAGELDAARLALEQAVNEYTAVLDPVSPDVADAQVWLARVLLEFGQRDQARQLAALAAAVHAHYSELGEHYRQPLRELQARVGGSP